MFSFRKFFYVGVLVAVFRISTFAANVTLAWNPSPDSSVAGYNIYYWPASGGSTNMVSAGNATSETISNLIAGRTYFFAATTYDSSGLESPLSSAISYTVPKSVTVTNPTNQPPTLNAIGNLTLNANAGRQTVNLSGITSGSSSETQTLAVTAVSSNPGLTPKVLVNYTSPNTTGTLVFTLATNVTGTATITVTVNDGGASNNLVTQTFTVTVNGAGQTGNSPPTLNAIGNLTINQNAGSQTVNLSGITSGTGSAGQSLTVTAMSSNPGLIPNPTVNYAGPNTTGMLTFAPVPNATGNATITITVNNGAASNNSITQTFNVVVNPVSQVGSPPPTLDAISNLTVSANAGLQTVNLSGIGAGGGNQGQTLTVTATSGNPSLIPNPTVNYASPNATGTLTFAPVANATGNATITVTVNNGTADNNIVTQTFMVAVNAINQTTNGPPTLNVIPNLTVAKGAGLQTVNLSGISAGAGNQGQPLTVTATTPNALLILNLAVHYTSLNATGTLTFNLGNTPASKGTISVVVNNGLATNNTVKQSFTVTITAAIVKTVTASAATAQASSPKIASPAIVVNAAATLTVTPGAAGQFAVNVAGATSNQYAVQASTDLMNWVSLQTNAAPFTFVETNASKFDRRFYRAVSLP